MSSITEFSGKAMELFMYAISYIEINTCCLIILALILKRHIRGLDKRMEANTFSGLIISTMIYVLLDMICGLQQNQAFHLSRAVSGAVNVAFFWSSFSLTHLAFAFAECELERDWVHDKRKRIISQIPAILLAIMTLGTLKYKYFFYIDEAGLYQKGLWYPVIIVLVYVYVIMIGVRVIWMYPQKRYYALRGQMKMVSSFVVIPLTAGIIQVFYPGISIVCFGITISMMQVFSQFLENKITTDSLTQINNRTKAIQYLENRMENRGKIKEKSLYFIMMDLNDFKKINDTYGHVEGDKALMTMAEVLKNTMTKYPGILARYGGDEFCIAGEFSEEEKDQLCAELVQNLEEENKISDKPYDIKMAVGCAKLTDDITMLLDLINKADKDLYEHKKKNRYKN